MRRAALEPPVIPSPFELCRATFRFWRAALGRLVQGRIDGLTASASRRLRPGYTRSNSESALRGQPDPGLTETPLGCAGLRGMRGCRNRRRLVRGHWLSRTANKPTKNGPLTLRLFLLCSNRADPRPHGLRGFRGRCRLGVLSRVIGGVSPGRPSGRPFRALAGRRHGSGGRRLAWRVPVLSVGEGWAWDGREVDAAVMAGEGEAARLAVSPAGLSSAGPSCRPVMG